MLHLTTFRGRFAAPTASQVEDFGLQAILEKMNSLNTPLFSGSFQNISKIFQNFLMISLVRWSVDDDGPFGLENQFFIIFRRTDLRMCPSEAKFDAEADFDVRSAVAPPKPHQINKKLIFRSENVADFFFWHRIFRRFFGLQVLYRAETWTTDRS